MAGTRDHGRGSLHYPAWSGRLAAWLSSAPPSEDVPEVASAPSPALAFDALISLGPYNLSAGKVPDAVVLAVRTAVSALPGAGWVDVRHIDVPLGPDCRWLEMFPRGTSEPMVGADWGRAHDTVRRLVLEIAGVARTVPAASADTE